MGFRIGTRAAETVALASLLNPCAPTVDVCRVCTVGSPRRPSAWGLLAGLVLAACVDVRPPWDPAVQPQRDAAADRRSSADRAGTNPFADFDGGAGADGDDGFEEGGSGGGFEEGGRGGQEALPDAATFEVAGPETGNSVDVGPPPPPAPPIVKASWAFEGTRIDWSGSSAPTYRVRRSTQPTGPFTDLASSLRGPPFVDVQAPIDAAVYYVVVAEAGADRVESEVARHVRTPNLVRNPGFELGEPLQHAPEWEVWSPSGHLAADYVDKGNARSGSLRLTQSHPDAFQIYSFHMFSVLTPGEHLVHAWVRSSGGQRVATFGVKICGGATLERLDVNKSRNEWREVTLTFTAVVGTCYEIGFWTDDIGGHWMYIDDVSVHASSP